MNIGPLALFIVAAPATAPLPLPLNPPPLSLPIPLSLLLLLPLVCLFLKHPEQYLYTLSIKTLALGHALVAQWASSCCPQCCHTHSAMFPPAGGPHVSSLCAPCGPGQLANWRRAAAVAHLTGLARFLVSVNSHTHLYTHTPTHVYTLAPTHTSFGIGLLWAL